MYCDKCGAEQKTTVCYKCSASTTTACSDASPIMYPCVRCGKLRTKDEGGTTFSHCDECWDATNPKKSTAESDNYESGVTRVEISDVGSGLFRIYVNGKETGDAIPWDTKGPGRFAKKLSDALKVANDRAFREGCRTQLKVIQGILGIKTE